MAISDAVGTERISRIVGYKITKGNFNNTTPNLPQSVAIIGEGNTANQGTMPLTATEITSAAQAGDLFGYGSPIHMAMRILRPNTSDGIGGIPTIVYPVAEAGGAVAKEFEITVTGAPTANATHTIVVNGRRGVDGGSYSFTVAVGQTPTSIAGGIVNAINSTLGCPFTASSLAGVVTIVSKTAGIVAEDMNVEIDVNDAAVGVMYAVVDTVSAVGLPDIQPALDQFGNTWHTVVLNTWNIFQTDVMDKLQTFNGKPDPVTPTGRYSAILMKPFISLVGSINQENAAETSPLANEVTHAVCPAPNSKGLPLEAAANMALLFARIEQDTPHLDVAGKSYSDMPTPDDIGLMSSYNSRDALVKDGNSTVDLVAGAYQIQDFITTYHPAGELPPQFRYCRNLMLDFNVRYGYYLLELINVVDHAIAEDDDVVTVGTVVKPKQWKGILFTYAEDLAKRALIVEPAFMKDSLEVGLSTTNPDRLETFFRYKRSGFTRIASTTAEAGFNFGEA